MTCINQEAIEYAEIGIGDVLIRSLNNPLGAARYFNKYCPIKVLLPMAFFYAAITLTLITWYNLKA